MIKLNEHSWNSHLLDNATLITPGKGYMTTYDLNNGEILKKLKDEDSLSSLTQQKRREDFIIELERKISLSKEIEDKSIVIPKTIYRDKDGRIQGYTTKKIEEENLDTILKGIESIELYESIFITLTEKIKLLNKEGIILPDLGNTTNVLYNPKNKRIYFIDYDGIQIKDSQVFSMANILEQEKNPMLNSTKYRKNKLFNENLDKLTLLLLYVYYTTGTNILYNIDQELSIIQLMNQYNLTQKTIVPEPNIFYDFFHTFGIEDTKLSELIQTVFDQTKANQYPDHAIKEITKTHTLKKQMEGVRHFIKK